MDALARIFRKLGFLFHRQKFNRELEEEMAFHREQQQKEFQATAMRQEDKIQALTAALKKQAAQIEKVSAQLELNKPAPRTVKNP